MSKVADEGSRTPSAPGRCPVCQRPADPVFRPFCSKRCSDIDLHRWLAGTYRIPTQEDPDPYDADEGSDRPATR